MFWADVDVSQKQKHQLVKVVSKIISRSMIHIGMSCTTKYSCLLLASCVVVPEEKYKEIVVKSKLNDNVGMCM